MHAEIQKLLTPLADPSYKTFSLALLPGLNMPMLGVRLPALRRLAKQLARQYNTQALHLLTDEFIVVNGDDFHSISYKFR